MNAPLKRLAFVALLAAVFIWLAGRGPVVTSRSDGTRQGTRRYAIAPAAAPRSDFHARKKKQDAAAMSRSGEKFMLSDEEWRKRLTPQQYQVLRQKGTERAFTGQYWNEHRKGIYRCAGCGQELFSSQAKFDSGTGWPSFWSPLSSEAIGTERDVSFFMVRTEVHCSRCGGHLGHVFDDGPPPTGLRYCMNSAALEFVPQEEQEDTRPE
jgi:peptide-methionine (R)-S-oxide reductase